jgi:hypothetical protein
LMLDLRHLEHEEARGSIASNVVRISSICLGNGRAKPQCSGQILTAS